MLVKVLCSHSIATRRRLPREGNVTFEDLMRGASDFDVRTVTIEGLTSVRYLLSVTVGIVTVIAAIWCDRGCGSDTPSRRKAYRGCHVPRARKRAWLGSLSPCGPSLSFGVGLRLDAFFGLTRRSQGNRHHALTGSAPLELVEPQQRNVASTRPVAPLARHPPAYRIPRELHVSAP
jgi:hypothetical protein